MEITIKHIGHTSATLTGYEGNIKSSSFIARNKHL